ncbi:ATP-binding protein [Corynebacterium suicordis]|uniref:ATP-binding protein n=1 Tax=Corynebacterium suicordis DSM 45110 TaxID=1121369 RepID=A0ABR9ZGG6_9CORY|nr:ATP-binding protein [Corynebacterium suicordis]MBF4552501.1 ATP-binding protein [Corynebacterium suicordis DSM 45110]MDR6278540.1 hypothetical protein [Corynebacterium suicordis]
MRKTVSVTPSARRLTNSLRDIGYSFESAIADLVDNSIAAGSKQIEIEIVFSGEKSHVVIIDDGDGMSPEELNEAFRFGSQRTYQSGQLGRYGLGLKTASLSQCRRLTVFTREKRSGTKSANCLDLDFINETDNWLITEPEPDHRTEDILKHLSPNGTVVLWDNLDRLLPSNNPSSTWARKKFETLSSRLKTHLSAVFHRFLSGEGVPPITISINGVNLQPWDPFARSESKTELVTTDKFEIDSRFSSGQVVVKSYCLPSRSQFSTQEAFEAAGGIRKWNRQQGLYIYRANRLVQWGGWDSIRTLDEHTKLARVSLDFGTELDDEFNINVAKMRVTVPASLKKLMSRSISDVCARADSRYRKDKNSRVAEQQESEEVTSAPTGYAPGAEVGLALKSAAARSGNFSAFKKIAELLKQEDPDLAKLLGL